MVLEQYLAILPEKIKPWVRARKPENCEKLVTLLESCKGTHEPEGETVQGLRGQALLLFGAASAPS